MTWLNPIALLGLLAVAVPVLVHLFGRRVAKRQRFPSLRLLQLAATTPVTRSQPSDILLLLIRCAIVVAGALALAQPRWSSPARQRLAKTPARVVIVDTSASMSRLTSDGRTALTVARALGRALVDSARVGMVIETAHPGLNVAAAGSWLSQQSGRRELVVVSDMQLGALGAGDFARVPDGVGVTLRKVEAGVSPSLNVGDSAVAITLDSTETRVTWRVGGARDSTASLTILGADSTRETALDVLRQLVPRLNGSQRIALVFPDYPGASEIARGLQPLDRPWQGDLFLLLRSDRLVRSSGNAPPSRDCSEARAAPIRNESGSLSGTIGVLKDRSPFELVVLSCAAAHNGSGAALLAAVARVAATVPHGIESDPVVVPDESLRKWERPATDIGPRGNEDTSPDGRWFWLLALVLLALEEWIRRRAPQRMVRVAVTEGRERVA